MTKRYFQFDREGDRAEILVYGDITSWPWVESDVSSWTLSQQLAQLGEDVKDVTVRINSYGGEVAEGIAIYNALKAHPAHVTTVCDGFACSIASVVFMAGDTRIMNEASLLMIHNAWSCASGDADELRKQADDLDTVTELSKKVYLAATDLTEEELADWMDAETFIGSDTALLRGFATEVQPIGAERMSQSAAMTVRDRLLQPMAVTEEFVIDHDEVGRMLYEILSIKYGKADDDPDEPDDLTDPDDPDEDPDEPDDDDVTVTVQEDPEPLKGGEEAPEPGEQEAAQSGLSNFMSFLKAFSER